MIDHSVLDIMSRNGVLVEVLNYLRENFSKICPP